MTVTVRDEKVKSSTAGLKGDGITEAKGFEKALKEGCS
jgi:hypothetical protein